jgi:hypothetical protein
MGDGVFRRPWAYYVPRPQNPLLETHTNPPISAAAQNANSATLADAVTLTPKTTLIMGNANSASQADAVTLPHGLSLVVDDNASTTIGNAGLGSELIPDSGFDTGTGWSIVGTATITGSQLVLPTTAFQGADYQSGAGAVSPGDVLFVQTNTQDVGGGSPYFTLGDGGGGDGQRYRRSDGTPYPAINSYAAGAQTFTFSLSHGANGVLYAANRSQGQSSTAEINSFSVKKIGAPLTLTPKTSLILAADNSVTLAGAITLGGGPLTIQADVSLTQAGAVTLSPKTALTVANDTSLTQAGAVTLAPKTPLIVANGVSTTLADLVTLSIPGRTIDAGDAISKSLEQAPGGLGPDLLNGDGLFASATNWSPGTGWTISGGVATAAAAGSNLDYSPLIGTLNLTHQLDFDLTITSGSLIPYYGGDSSNVVTTSGHKTLNVTPTISRSLTMLPAVVLTCTLDNITLKELGVMNLTVHSGLVVANAVSATTTTSPAVVQRFSITVAGANSVTLAGNVVLGNIRYALILSAANSVTLADSLSVGAHLTMNAANSVTLADAVTLTPKTTLAPSAAVSLTQAGNVAAVGHSALTVANDNSLTQADPANVTFRLFDFLRAGKDHTTGEFNVADPGTVIYKGDYFQSA